MEILSSDRVRWRVLALLLLFCLPFTVAVSDQLSALDNAVMPVTLAPEHWEALALTAENVEEYGAFVWAEVGPEVMATIAASGLPYQSYPAAYTLHLGGQSFDTRRGGPELPAGLDEVSAEGPDLHLVQLKGPTKSVWLDELEASGLEIVQYLHPHTYVVWGNVPRIESDVVRWTGPFAPAYRLLPEYRDVAGSPAVRVLVYRHGELAETVAAMEQIAGASDGSAILNDTWAIYAFHANSAQAVALANVPGVYAIKPVPTDGGHRGEMSNQINVNNHDGSNAAFTGYASWLTAAGVDGTDVIMANVDGGIWDTHPDLVNRMLPCTGITCGGSATDEHGTHTAGIMAGDGSSGVTDGGGFLRGQGMAPGANLIEQLYAPFFTQPGGMFLIMTESAQNDAVLSGNSWGPAGSPRGYDDDTLQVDIGVRDAITGTVGNQEFTYVLSFMNGGGGTSTQGTPDEAKNIFTIGSTKMQTSGGVQILDINDLSANSAHGPALDGRTIPHMVAPGCYVDSTLTATGYGMNCGTSMASPHVSGAIGLFFEYYRDLFAADPSPAMVKAAFLPVAHDLAGFDDADGNTLGHPFDNKQGWGRMDAAAVVSPTVDIVYYDQQTLFDETGEDWSMSVSAVDPGEPVRLMLVWTDAPGHGLGGTTPAWNNDLNLTVSNNGNNYVGNNFGPDGWSVPGGSYDGINNTEGIFLETVTGLMIVTVDAANITSDGVPGVGDETDQDFALVCYNCTLTPIEYDEFLYLPLVANRP